MTRYGMLGVKNISFTVWDVGGQDKVCVDACLVVSMPPISY